MKTTLKYLVRIGCSAIAVAGAMAMTAAHAAIITVAPNSLTDCPAVGFATHCAIEYRFNADGSIDTLLDPTISSTDGAEDTLFGIKNNTGAAITTIFLDGTSVGLDLFGFDGDGQSTIVSTGVGATYFGKFDQSGVGAKDLANTFTVLTPFKGNVNFGGMGLIGGGGSAWFVLEEQINFSAPPAPPGGTVPAPATLLLLGVGALAARFARRKS